MHPDAILSFALRLGREFKRPDYLNLLHELTCTEFDSWAFYFSESLFTFELTEIEIGQITAAIYNASGRYKNVVTASSLIPKKHRQKTIKEQIAIWQALSNG